MRRPPLRTVVLGISLLLVACSQGISLQEYYSQMSDIAQTQKKQTDDLQATSEEEITAATDEATQVQLIQKFFEDNLAVAKTALTQVQDISPPSEVEEAHEKFLQAFEDLVAALDDASASIESASTGAEISTVITDVGPKIEGASAKFDAACADLETVATDNSVKAGLDCGGS